MISYIVRIIGLAVGALIYTLGLDIFLVPNQVIDGGIVGVSLMVAQVTGLSFSVFIILFNIPFLFWGIRKLVVYLQYYRLYLLLAYPFGIKYYIWLT